VGPSAVRARGVPPPAGPVAVARVLVLTADLLFGSRVQGALVAAGREAQMVADERRLREQLAAEGAPSVDVLVVDLTDAALGGAEIVASLGRGGELGGTRTLGIYSHVDPAARAAAEEVGFDLVVPRSRMAREGAELVTRLAAG
jgi:DNA-binding NarL/FixJ family response regulator